MVATEETRDFREELLLIQGFDVYSVGHNRVGSRVYDGFRVGVDRVLGHCGIKSFGLSPEFALEKLTELRPTHKPIQKPAIMVIIWASWLSICGFFLG